MTIAIDPGASGGIAYVDNDGIVRAENLPQGMTAIADRLLEMALDLGHPRTVLEKTGTHFPGNNASATAKFARHCGWLEAICYCRAMPVEQVDPKIWQKEIRGLSAIPRPVKPKKTGNEDADSEAARRHGKALAKYKDVRKHHIRDEMQRRYPHLKVTLKTADALGILAWANK